MSGALGRLSATLGALSGLAWTQRQELVRQPTFGVVLAVGVVAVALSPALALFALGRAEAVVLDLGASTVLFFGVFLAAAAVAAGTAERLQDGTTTLVLTKPVGPLGVLAGGFLGAALALVEAGVVLGSALLLATRNGPDARRDVVAVPGALALFLALAWGVRASVVRRTTAFQPAAHGALLLLLPLAYLVVLALDGSHATGEHASHDATALAAATLATLAALAYAALGVCLGTRLPPAGAAVLTLVGFVLGSLVQAAGRDAGAAPSLALGAALAVAGWLWLVGVAWHVSAGWGAATLLVLPGALFAVSHPARARGPLGLLVAGGVVLALGATLGGTALLSLVVPDLQLYWVGDAAYGEVPVPASYVAEVALSTAAYCAGALGVGALVLGGRELPT